MDRSTLNRKKKVKKKKGKVSRSAFEMKIKSNEININKIKSIKKGKMDRPDHNKQKKKQEKKENGNVSPSASQKYRHHGMERKTIK